MQSPPAPGARKGLEYIDLNERPVLNFKFKVPIAFDPWDVFECAVRCRTTGGYKILIRIRPLQQTASNDTGSDYNPCVITYDPSARSSSMEVLVDIGRNYMDGTRHVICFNLSDLVREALQAYDRIPDALKSDWYILQGCIRCFKRGEEDHLYGEDTLF